MKVLNCHRGRQTDGGDKKSTHHKIQLVSNFQHKKKVGNFGGVGDGDGWVFNNG